VNVDAHLAPRTIVLDEGTAVRLRAIRPDDESRLIALYDRLSQHSAYQRFFTLMPRLPQDRARRLANVDYQTRFALVLERDGPDGPTLIGVGRYEPSPEPGVAEVAFVVQDEYQGKRLGRLLLDELLATATAHGIPRFRAYVLADNRRMLDLLNRHTRVIERRRDASVIEVLFERRA
jgi:RimJ/RimL family protein N-acetyltransferase